MDQKKLQKRLENIDLLVEQLVGEKAPQYAEMEAHLNSPYYKNALEHHPEFLIPAENIEEFKSRLAAFKETRHEEVFGNAPVTSQAQLWFSSNTVRVGLVADEFFFKSFEGTTDITYVTPSNFHSVMEEIDLLIVSSTWRGVDGQWEGVLDKDNKLYKVLLDEVFASARQCNVPVAFYSKEDPPNYQTFLPFAKKADYIFTTSLATIERYKKDCPEALAVECIPFAVNPLHHNPINSQANKGEYAVFAGSWFRHKYGERRLAASKVLDGFSKSKLELKIYDRNSGINRDRYLFPERYIPYLHDSISHDASLEVQQQAKWAVNMNSVVDSQTMFANRVLELQALGTPVISNYNAGVNSEFPHVFIPDSENDLLDYLDSKTPRDYLDLVSAGVRKVFMDYHAFDAMNNLLRVTGQVLPDTRRTVTIISETSALFDSFMNSQSYDGFVKNCNLNDLDQIVTSEIVIAISSQFDYHENYLKDAVAAFRFSDSSVISFERFTDNNSTSFYSKKELEINGFKSAFWFNDPAASDAFWRTMNGENVRIATLVLPGFKEKRQKSPISNPLLSVVVPVYNNGGHLKHKCFQSLRRSSIFEDMEIILVDDGSNETATIAVLEELNSLYDNVVLHRFPLGGSGSASRPRNKGLELATGEFVTYLDPDNEALNDGFRVLLEAVRESNVDFAIGNMIKFSSKRQVINNCHHLRKNLSEEDGSSSVLLSHEDALAKIKFQPMSIQALVTRTAWLRDLGITQPEGAVGQDSYFFQQMLHYAGRIYVSDLPIHSYYAAVANSTVNSLNPRFYEKYLPLEASRAAWLDSVGLLQAYRDHRMMPFLDFWYLSKLRSVSNELRDECYETISKLMNFYEPGCWSPELLKVRFSELYPGK